MFQQNRLKHITGIKHVKGIKIAILPRKHARLSDEWAKDIHKNNKYLPRKSRGKVRVPRFLQANFLYDYASLTSFKYFNSVPLVSQMIKFY